MKEKIIKAGIFTVQLTIATAVVSTGIYLIADEHEPKCDTRSDRCYNGENVPRG